MKKIKIKEKENEIVVFVNSKVYPLEAVYGAAYVFLDRAYIYLDGDPEKEIFIYLKGKEKLTEKSLREMGNEFLNELLNYSLRYSLSKNNKKIREYLIGASLFGASGETVIPSEVPEEKGEKEKGKEEDWEKDTLGIATPWEDKYGKKGNSK